MRVCVSYNEICTHSEYEGGHYGSWSESYSSSIERVYVLGDNEKAPYHSDVFLLPDEAEKAYVVYMIYDTGDSFGNADGRIAIIHCATCKISVNMIAKAIRENPEMYSFKFTDDFGREISLYNPASGYFEHVSCIEVEEYDLGRKKRYQIN